MRNLIVIAYEHETLAEQVRIDFIKMQKDYLVDIEDAVVAVVKENGKVKLRQLYNMTLGGVMGGGFWGLLIGMIFLNPLLGFVIGAGTGAIAGALSDVGINDSFMKELAANLKPGSSVLFMLVRSEITDKVLNALSGTGGKIMQTSLSHDDEERLQKAISFEFVQHPFSPIIPRELAKKEEETETKANDETTEKEDEPAVKNDDTKINLNI